MQCVAVSRHIEQTRWMAPRLGLSHMVTNSTSLNLQLLELLYGTCGPSKSSAAIARNCLH